MSRALKFIDIGANLTDPQFRGIYRGTQKHLDDFSAILVRAREQGIEKILVTGSNLDESRAALDLGETYRGVLYSSAGVHPCHAAEVPENQGRYFADLERLVEEGKRRGVVKAFGEIGLDYDRLHYATKDQQLAVFRTQLDMAPRLGLPLFLHSRACADDFEATLRPYIDSGRLPRGGVVHSFTGTVAELEGLLALGLYIGVNGCSLKTEQNLAVVKAIPLDRLMLESDGPWCEIRPSHASFKHTEPLPYKAVKPEKFDGGTVRGRCEPCMVINVAQVVAAVKQVPIEEVAAAAWANSVKVFAL